jgi:hypothetical protein
MKVRIVDTAAMRLVEFDRQFRIESSLVIDNAPESREEYGNK